MNILSIETSCDETAVSIIQASGGLEKPSFRVLSSLVLSQIKIHEKYGGVFPNLAKREHSKNLGPLLRKALEEAALVVPKNRTLDEDVHQKIKNELSREPELYLELKSIVESIEKPEIDLIAVTSGPGLEPALWVGINAAKVLGEVWGIPVMPVNHMEGHISSVLLNLGKPVQFPALALLISGGHTELVLVPDWLSYKIVGETRDDAVGEAYDKVARMLGLPYPGGPKVAAYAEEVRRSTGGNPDADMLDTFKFPRPMMLSGDSDFSFSGLKTSVLYTIRNLKKADQGQDLNEETKKAVAYSFEEAVIETLLTKTKKAMQETGTKTLIIAGGVIANKAIRQAFEKLVSEFPGVQLLVPTHELSTDNALMIALAAYIRHTKNPEMKTTRENIRAEGNMRLE